MEQSFLSFFNNLSKRKKNQVLYLTCANKISCAYDDVFLLESLIIEDGVLSVN